MADLGRIWLPDDQGELTDENAVTTRVRPERFPAGRFTTLDVALRFVIASDVRDPRAAPWASPEIERHTHAGGPRFAAALVVDGGGRLGSARFQVYPWTPDAAVAGRLDDLPPLLGTNVARASLGPVVAVAFRAGRDIYLPDPTDWQRLLRLARMREFYALPDAARNRQLDNWRARLSAVPDRERPHDPPLYDTLPYTRLAVAAHAGHTLPVGRAHYHGKVGAQQPPPRTPQRVTIPLPRADRPLEPECYLLAFIRHEGRLESINAYDGCAGLSIGPVQVNLIGNRVLRFVLRLWHTDRSLFRRVFQPADPPEVYDPSTDPFLYWEVRQAATGGSHWLWVRSSPVDGDCQPVPGPAVTGALALKTEDDGRSHEEYLTSLLYFQSGRYCVAIPPRTSCRRLFTRDHTDPRFRMLIAQRFRDAVAWPHVQELVAEACVQYLNGGLRWIHRRFGKRLADADFIAGTAEARDLYIYKATILAGYVRFAGSPGVLLHRSPGRTASTRLRQLRALLADDTKYQEFADKARIPLGDRADLRARLRATAAPKGPAADAFTELRAMLRALQPRE